MTRLTALRFRPNLIIHSTQWASRSRRSHAFRLKTQRRNRDHFRRRRRRLRSQAISQTHPWSSSWYGIAEWSHH